MTHSYRFRPVDGTREARDLPVVDGTDAPECASGDFPPSHRSAFLVQPGNCRKGIVCANRRVTTQALAGSDAAENAPADKDLRSLAHVMKRSDGPLWTISF